MYLNMKRFRRCHLIISTCMANINIPTQVPAKHFSVKVYHNQNESNSHNECVRTRKRDRDANIEKVNDPNEKNAKML